MKREKITICSGENMMPLCMELLVSRLQSDIGAERKHAREALVKIGKSVVPLITELMTHPESHVRWEACKTLQRIRDPKTASLLATMLMDEDMDVRWVAADALIELEHHAIVPLLETIEENFDSVIFREAAHHVLHSLKESRLLDDKTEQVMDALRPMEVSSKAAFIANRVLDHVRSHIPIRRHRLLV